MNHPKQNPRGKALLLLLVFGCAVLLATGTYAAYISHGSLKRVAVARTLDTGGMRFSSNHLFSCGLDETNYLERTIGVTITEGSDVQIGITVCNYPQSSNATFNDKDISYTVTASCEGVTGISVSPSVGTLQGGKPSSLIHIIKVPYDAVNTVANSLLTVVVTPDDASKAATQNRKLAANLKLLPTEAVATGWKDTIMFEGNSENNDAINYYIHGTEECNMTLRWGPTIDLGQWSIESLEVTSSGDNYVTIHVGGPGQPTSYYLQFYRKEPAEQNETKESLGISFVKGS